MLSGDHWGAGNSLCQSDVHPPFSPRVHCLCFSLQWTAMLASSFPWMSTSFLYHVSDGIFSQMLSSLDANRTVGNNNGCNWYHCLVPGLEGISANDSLFIMRLTYSSWLSEFVFQLFSGRIHCLLSYWAFISEMAILLFSCYDAHLAILHLAAWQIL